MESRLLKELTLGKPTQAIPGTPEKLRVMRQRADAGEQIFHPQDLRFQHARYNEKPDFVSVNVISEVIAERFGMRLDFE